MEINVAKISHNNLEFYDLENEQTGCRLLTTLLDYDHSV